MAATAAAANDDDDTDAIEIEFMMKILIDLHLSMFSQVQVWPVNGFFAKNRQIVDSGHFIAL